MANINGSMKIKALRVAGLIGLSLFLVMLIIYLIMGFFWPPLLVTIEFATTVRPLAFIIAVYAGLSISLTYFGNILRRYEAPSRIKLLEYISKQKGRLLLIVISSLLIGYMTYSTVIDVLAGFLHEGASKEAVQLEVRTTSVWSATRDLRKNCQYHLLFDAPRISSDIQYICLDWDQWLHFQGATYPITITLQGKKSYYGYELQYQK